MSNFSSGGGVPLLQGHLVRYLLFAITPRRMYRLGSFFNMMRISSSATNGTKGVCFCSAVFEKLASKLDPSFTTGEEKPPWVRHGYDVIWADFQGHPNGPIDPVYVVGYCYGLVIVVGYYLY